ncbi:MAG: prepilin-type N-terminal cleavage/methylation domain-containing protein [Planctomycetes bacterium]|nr:prepilin-type N-terminal cleavage/methylation domain-containing protein [Planctomycetota bacterium]MBI3846797.1 prepilin-type N-terminal cleavage/methylation domain-containing protein [Planctomycetota bacterium]
MKSYRHRAHGFTLLEMLVVLSIISMLMGLGVGVYLRITANLTPSLAIGRIKTLLRQARNTALREASPSVVTVDVKEQTVLATASRTVAYWHCEDGEGAFGRNLSPVRGAFVAGGRIGNALKIEEGGYADAGTGPELDVREGLSIEAYVKPDSVRAQTIARKGEAYVFGITGDGYLTAHLSLAGGSREELVAEKGAIPDDRWSRVGVLYNRVVLALYVDGREVARKEVTRRLEPEPTATFTIGAKSGTFVGLVDEVRVREILASEAVHMPQELQLVGGGDSIVVFDAAGGLDPEWHAGPVKIPMKLALGGEARQVSVSVLGTVE